MKNKNKGFFQIIIIVVVAVILLWLIGYNPEVIWSEKILPILNWFWNIFITILDLIISTLSKFLN